MQKTKHQAWKRGQLTTGVTSGATDQNATISRNTILMLAHNAQSEELRELYLRDARIIDLVDDAILKAMS